jgi:hypothetical protein
LQVHFAQIVKVAEKKLDEALSAWNEIRDFGGSLRDCEPAATEPVVGPSGSHIDPAFSAAIPRVPGLPSPS